MWCFKARENNFVYFDPVRRIFDVTECACIAGELGELGIITAGS